MGLFSSSKGDAVAAALPPAPQPIGVLPEFTRHTGQMTLKVREKKLSFTGDDFSVKDAITGQVVFKVDGHALTLSGRKDILDATGRKLFTLKKKHITIHTTFNGIAPDDSILFKVKANFHIGTSAKLTASFNNVAGGGGETELVLKGDWFDRKATITTASGIPVASIGRSFLNAGEIFSDKQTYILNIAPGVDAALLLAICICLDETQNEPK